MPKVTGEASPALKLRQDIRDARRWHEIIAVQGKPPAIVAFGKAGPRHFREPQSVAGKQRGIAAGQIP